MSDLVYYIDELPERELPVLSGEEAGDRFNKWSYLFAYYPNVLRDIFLISKDISGKSKKDITEAVNKLRINKQDGKKWTPWNERYVLEYLNSLKKIGFWDEKGEELKSVFVGRELNSELSDNDIEELREVFFSYFRFKELSSWFIDPSPEFHKEFEKLNQYDLIEKSRPLYFYSENGRFYDSFLFDVLSPSIKYVIKDEALMRFWDVYLKWGLTLGVLDKFNVSKILNPIKNKEVSVVYFITEFAPFDLDTFIYENFDTRNIWIPELIYKVAKKYRYSVDAIKEFIVRNINTNDKITFERTSEIFLIKGKTSKKNIKEATYLYPLIDDYYISNLILRK